MSTTPEQSTSANLPIAAFVFGLASIPMAFLPWGVLVGPIAIVLGLVANGKTAGNVSRQRFARAGAIFGLGGTLIWLTIYGLIGLFAA